MIFKMYYCIILTLHVFTYNVIHKECNENVLKILQNSYSQYDQNVRYDVTL